MSSQERSQEAADNQQNKGEIVTEIPAKTALDFKVWNPPNGPVAPIRGNPNVRDSFLFNKSNFSRRSSDLPDSYFEPTLSELKASYDAQVRAREALVNAPLKTKEVREIEFRAKLQKYPTVGRPICSA